jgi:hypothetical protein
MFFLAENVLIRTCFLAIRKSPITVEVSALPGLWNFMLFYDGLTDVAIKYLPILASKSGIPFGDV